MIKDLKEFLEKHQAKFETNEELQDLAQALNIIDDSEKQFKDLKEANMTLRENLVETMKHTGTKNPDEDTPKEPEFKSLEEIASELLK